MEPSQGKKISVGICPHGHALLWVGQECVHLTPEQLRTLVRLGTEALSLLGELDEFDLGPAPALAEFH